jgi:hypothetical protein
MLDLFLACIIDFTDFYICLCSIGQEITVNTILQPCLSSFPPAIAPNIHTKTNLLNIWRLHLIQSTKAEPIWIWVARNSEDLKVGVCQCLGWNWYHYTLEKCICKPTVNQIRHLLSVYCHQIFTVGLLWETVGKFLCCRFSVALVSVFKARIYWFVSVWIFHDFWWRWIASKHYCCLFTVCPAVKRRRRLLPQVMAPACYQPILVTTHLSPINHLLAARANPGNALAPPLRLINLLALTHLPPPICPYFCAHYLKLNVYKQKK